VAKKLLEFKSVLDRLKRDIEAEDKAAEAHSQRRSHLEKLVDEGAKAIGQRVQELRSKGYAGTTLRDFLNTPTPDKQLLELSKGIDQVVGDIGRDVAVLKNKISNQFKKTVEAWTKVLAELEQETKNLVKTKDPSVPAFDNLLKGYATVAHEQRFYFKLVKEGPRPIDIADFKRTIDKEVQRSSVDARAVALRRMLEPRHLTTKKGGVLKLRQEILKEFDNMKTAQAAKNAGQIAALLKIVYAKKAQLDPTVSEFHKAIIEFKDALDDDKKEGPKIVADVKQMVEWQQDIDRKCVLWSAATKRASVKF